jgi:hypothetical protein
MSEAARTITESLIEEADECRDRGERSAGAGLPGQLVHAVDHAGGRRSEQEHPHVRAERTSTCSGSVTQSLERPPDADGVKPLGVARVEAELESRQKRRDESGPYVSQFTKEEDDLVIKPLSTGQ